MQNLVEAEMIQRAMKGDEGAFRIVVEKYQPFVSTLSYRFVGNRSDAEDITQEVFLRLWKNFHKYQTNIRLSTWLYRIVANLSLDMLRSRHHKSSQLMEDVEANADAIAGNETDQELLKDEFALAVLKMSELLTPRQKAAFILRDVEGLEVDEVCEILSVDASTLKSNLYYARLKMNGLLKKYFGEKKRTL